MPVVAAAAVNQAVRAAGAAIAAGRRHSAAAAVEISAVDLFAAVSAEIVAVVAAPAGTLVVKRLVSGAVGDEVGSSDAAVGGALWDAAVAVITIGVVAGKPGMTVAVLLLGVG